MPLTTAGPKGYFIPEPHVVDGPFTLGDLEIIPLSLPHGRRPTAIYSFKTAKSGSRT